MFLVIKIIITISVSVATLSSYSCCFVALLIVVYNCIIEAKVMLETDLMKVMFSIARITRSPTILFFLIRYGGLF